MNAMDKECIRAFADAGMNASEAGRRMYVHKNTILYHFDRVKKETGLDPRKFNDLVELLDIMGNGGSHEEETELVDQ